MDLVPLRVAAGNGAINGYPAPQLVSAGFTLLQRSASLVRSLARKRAAILLPNSPQFLVALAAADGRGAVLVNPVTAAAEVARQLRDADVAAVFTDRALASKIPDHLPRVLLDEAPRRATLVSPGSGDQPLDLGSHFGLSLEGDRDALGRDEECTIEYASAMQGQALSASLTHRALLASARQSVEAAAMVASDHVLALLPFSQRLALAVSLVAPLLVGASVTTMPRFDPIDALDLLAAGDVTVIVGAAAEFEGMLGAIARRGEQLKGGRLRLCICGGLPPSAELQREWQAATGAPLRHE